MSLSNEDSLQISQKDSESHPPAQTSIIATFPNELLLQFFTIATIVDILADFDFRDVLYLTHVCARWRTIALNYPILWNQLSSTMPGDIARWFLQHSQEALLQVYVGRDFTNASVNEDTSQGICHTILDGVLRQASRVETLYLCRPMSYFFFPDSVLDPASHFTHLRSVTLRCLEAEGTCEILTNYSDLVFIARAPSLSHLVLWRARIHPSKTDTDLGNVDASILSNIKHLEIGGDNVGYSSQLTTLYATGLGKMSNLVCLELSFGDQPDDNADWSSTEALGSFPRLTLLSIIAPPSICIYLLTTIITPPTTRLRIVCTRPWPEPRPPRLGHLMTLICSRLDDHHRFHSLVLDGSQAYDYQISGWIEAGHGLFGHHASAADSPHLDFKLPWQKGPRKWDSYAKSELASCMEAVRDSSLGHVETLTIRVLKSTQTDWPSFLRFAIGVRVLKIWSNGLLSKLVNTLSVKKNEVLLPALRSLQIAEGTETVLSGRKAEATAAVLLRCIKTRKDAGVPVDELMFERLSRELREEVESSPLVGATKLTWV